MNILVDSSVWIDFFNGQKNAHTDKLSSLLSTELISIGDIILLEILQGIKNERDFKITKSYLQDLQCHQLSNPSLALKAANHFRYLRSMGVTIRKTIDVVIATFCIENDFMLLHNDKDFKPFVTHLKLKTFNL